MSKRESIGRYNLIITKLRKHSASFAQLSQYLASQSELQSYNFNISKRTFQRDLDDIRSLYNIDIQYDFSQKVYFIDLDDQPGVNERILEAFDTFNVLNLTDRLSDHIHFEKRKPQGTENLYGLLHAIRNKFQVNFIYLKFWEEASTERKVQPFALKEFKSRWYLLANDLKDQRVKSFALDRLMDMVITKRTFTIQPNFDVIEYYKYCFGIVGPNEQYPQEIILSFTPFQGKYIKSLPLHTSQEIIVDNDKELQIRLTLFITYDFKMELLSFGENLKVIQPQSLVKELKTVCQHVLMQYK